MFVATPTWRDLGHRKPLWIDFATNFLAQLRPVLETSMALAMVKVPAQMDVTTLKKTNCWYLLVSILLLGSSILALAPKELENRRGASQGG